MKNEKQFQKKWFNDENGLFYNCSHILDYEEDNGHTVDIAIVFSGRGRRKSFNISATLIKRCYLEGKKFGYVRRYDKELTTESVNRYFADKELCVDENGKEVGNFIEELTEGKGNCIRYFQQHFFIAKKYTDEKSGKLKYENIQDIGSVFSMSLAEQYKSLQYPDYIAMIFEEFLTNESYIVNEPNKLLNLISTIKRNRKDFTCFMVANTISRINPYVSDWSLNKMNTMKPSDTHYYHLNDGTKTNGIPNYYLISVEYLQNKEDEIVENKASRKKQRFITNTNNWEELNRYKTIPLTMIREYIDNEPITLVFEYKTFKYKAILVDIPINLIEYINEEVSELLDETKQYLYIERKTTDRKKGTRLYTDNPDSIVDNLTTKGFRPMCNFDKNIALFISNGWVIFADNLTGNEFYQSFNALRLL